MKRVEKISKLKEEFQTNEIFCNHICATFGDNSWSYLSNEFIDTMYFFRFELFKAPMFVNYPKQGRVERGIRCNCCKITIDKTKQGIAYMTGHNLDGCDFDVQGLTAEQARKIIKENQQLLPNNIRLEIGCSWVHWDKRNYTSNKIIEFSK